MGDIVSDSLEARGDLVAAGFSPRQADSVVNVAYGVRSGLATRADIRDLRQGLRDVRSRMQDMATSRDLIGLKGALNQRMDDLRDELNRRMDELNQRMDGQKGELKQDMADLKGELIQEMRSQRVTDRWVFSLLWGLMVATLAASGYMG